jgi:hypothetical protein
VIAGTLGRDIASPSAADLLTAWELGLPGSPAQRGVVLLGALLPARPLDDVLAMSVGERDAHLLEARRLLFGPQLECVVTCPECASDLELGVGVDDLLSMSDDAPGGDGRSDEDLQIGRWRLRVRALELRDLLDASGAADPAAGRELLLDRCIMSAVDVSADPGESQTASAIPADVEGALVAELERRNPTGALDFELTCPECATVWLAPFDVVAFLWVELDGWARRTLDEIHQLATAYGWTEPEVLALSAWRRAAYLQMSGHG